MLRTTSVPFVTAIDIARWRDDELRIIDVTNRTHILGHYRGAHYFEKIVEIALASPDIWVGTCTQIADYVLARNGP